MSEDNLFAEIRALRLERREDHGTVMAKLDAVGEVVSQLTLRIIPLENAHHTVKWAYRGAAGLVLAGLVDLVVDHLPRWFKP